MEADHTPGCPQEQLAAMETQHHQLCWVQSHNAMQQLTTKPQSRSESPGKPSVASWLYAVHCADSKSLSDGSTADAVLDAPKMRSCR